MFASQLLGEQKSLLLHEERRGWCFGLAFAPAGLQEGRARGPQRKVKCCPGTLGARVQSFTVRVIHRGRKNLYCITSVMR